LNVFFTDQFVLPLPAGHRFPMQKYALLRQRVVVSRLVPERDLRVPESAGEEQLALAHDRDYIRRVFDGGLTEAELKRIGFPWSPEMVERSRRSSGATLAACRAALADGCAVNLAGGTHHAFRDRGEGFCVFNDSAVAARTLLHEGRVRRVVVIDCDVHQGNGTAVLFAGDPAVLTFSVHSATNYPLRKEVSDLDVALPDRAGDAVYLDALDAALWKALAAARADLAIYVSGADPFEDDRLGRLSVSRNGLAERDRMVFEACRAEGLPVAVTMAGGYARRVEDTVAIHFRTVALAKEICGG
jgi:acetoin utilization deacetylase AcuC-like enzyme